MFDDKFLDAVYQSVASMTEEQFNDLIAGIEADASDKDGVWTTSTINLLNDMREEALANLQSRLGREGYFDDSKPTMREAELLALKNNDSNNQMAMYSEITSKHYIHLDTRNQ
ncbi:hypothetical protein [Burkholderia contaminans]|uniref:hypothetical protein n=1 Tax=Burkholderia contaminans TaxID=488447 RepID=UPI00158AE47D|nr:hypothetical protein [Burkholderia contaminans]